MFDKSKSFAISSLGSSVELCKTLFVFRVEKGSFGVSVDKSFIVSSTFRVVIEMRRRGSRDVTLLSRKLRVPTLETSPDVLLGTCFIIFLRLISEAIGLPIVTRLTEVRTRTDELRSTETVTCPLLRLSSHVLQTSSSSPSSSSP